MNIALTNGEAYPLRPATQASLLTSVVLVPLFFLMPFGELQDVALGGLTVPKILMPLSLVMVAIFAAGRFVFRPFTGLLLAFVLFTTPSFLTSVEFLPVFGSMVGAFLIVAMITNGAQDFRDIQLMMRAYLLGMAIVTVAVALAAARVVDVGVFLGHPLVKPDWSGLPFFQGTESNTTSFGLFFAIGMPLALNECIHARNWTAKVALSLLLVMMLFELLATLARSSLIAVFIAGCFVSAYGLSPRVKWLLGATLVIAGTVGTVLLLNALADPSAHTNQILRGIQYAFETKQESGSIHESIFGAALELATSAPPWGLGFSNMPNQIRVLTGYALFAHDSYLTIWVEYGLPAFLAFAGFYLGCCYEAWCSASREKDPVRGSYYATLAGITAGLIVSSVFHDDYVNSTVWGFFGLALATAFLSQPRMARA